ncbi:hypothetical protein jhhlp_004934 [Lomentospora prolificans]|uniref:Dethiobiotin synthase n=1 Tax=Lomentospora prolificans TaxID=41688 RepID=A0A2N3N7Z7_9PEZI|nr:hypothetical protein jhhlp_004934 [Lomentospora prolificans]
MQLFFLLSAAVGKRNVGGLADDDETSNDPAQTSDLVGKLTAFDAGNWPCIMAPVGALLWRSLKTFQIYGANTDVGKTIFTTLLCNACRKFRPHDEISFLKPVSTGPQEDADDWLSPHLAAATSDQPTPTDAAVLKGIRHHVLSRAGHGRGWLFLETAGGIHSPGPSGTTQADLYTPLRLPVILVGDSKLGGISQTIASFESLKMRGYDIEALLLFENAHYDNHSYLSEYFTNEHGIPVQAFRPPPPRSDHASDFTAMRRYYEEASSSGEARSVIDNLEKRHEDRVSRVDAMARDAYQTIWYPFTQHGRLSPDRIMTITSAYGDYFQTVVPKSPDSPPEEPLLQPSFDASASWWTQGLGHANPKLTLAASYAAGRYGHVMFAEAIHEPAIELAKTLLKVLDNPRMSRVFYSDNGSTGMEVAVKMALRATRERYKVDTKEKLQVIGLKGSYHGDTMGAMDSTEPSVYNEKVEWYDGKGFWFDYPTVLCSDGTWSIQIPDSLVAKPGQTQVIFDSLSSIFDIDQRRMSPIYNNYTAYIRDTIEELVRQGRKFGALLMEPLVLGAGGMMMVDPLFQRALVDVVRDSASLFDAKARSVSSTDPHAWVGLPVIFDEVFTGLTRLGPLTSASFLDVHPDISVHAKLLTGGLVPLCATVASEAIFDAFHSEHKSDALLHGHSYTAHPVGCQVALESVKELESLDARGVWDWAKESWNQGRRSKTTEITPRDSVRTPIWSVWSEDFVNSISSRHQVAGVWALGTVLAIHMKDTEGTGYTSNSAARVQEALLAGESIKGRGSWNIHSRVLGNVLYVMTGQTTSQEEVERLQRILGRVISS